MTAGDRFKGWIEARAGDWGGRLAAWFGNWFAGGLLKFGEDRESEIINLTRETIQKVIDNPDVPPEIKSYLRKTIQEGDILNTLAGYLLSLLGLLGVMSELGRPLGQLLGNTQNATFTPQRLPPEVLIALERRFPGKYSQLARDFDELGWYKDRVDAMRDYTLFYPGPSDLVRFQAREVFEPEMISRYGLDDEFGNIDLEPFRKAGMTDEVTLYYWRAHWEHASWQQVVEMLHRGQLTEDEVRDWFRLVEIPPFWRDKLIATSWNVPTRVDVRRFYDLRTINESRLREIYTAMGYHGKDLDDYVLWTKVYVEYPDLLARWKNGWITLEQLKSRLTELGMSPEAAEELIQTKIKAEGYERTAAERDLTRADIYKAVKEERITRLEGLGLLMDLGYDENEASLILDLYAPDDETASAVAQRQLSKADLRAGLQEELLTPTGVLQGLIELRYSPADAEFLLRLFQATAKPPTEVKLKEASKADIVLGVTKGLITPQEGHAMLLEIGYAPEAADFILLVKTTESPFSPVNFNELKDLTDKWRRSAGMPVKPQPEEIRKAADALVKAKLEVESLERLVKAEGVKLVPDETVPQAAKKKRTEAEIALNRARAEVQRLQLDYNAVVAKFKQAED